MNRVIKISVMVLVAVFAISTAASAQTKKWAYQSDYEEGMACVKDDQGKWGHIDEQGKLVGQMWRNVKYFQEGLAPVENEDELWGFVDKTGKVVIPFNFKNAYSFEKGNAKVQDADRQWRKIDKTGKYIE